MILGKIVEDWIRRIMLLSALGSALTLSLASGCATPSKASGPPPVDHEKQQLRAQLNDVLRERDRLGHELQNARQDADSLRAQLASMPPPVEEPAPGWTAVPGGAMIAIEDSVLFASGKVVLRDEARKTLDAIVSTIRSKYDQKDVLVFGHTDDRPIKKSGWSDNWELSTERALSVVRYLQEHGIPASRLVAAGCGENRPRDPNKSEVSRTANRRVEIYAVDPDWAPGRR